MYSVFAKRPSGSAEAAADDDRSDGASTGPPEVKSLTLAMLRTFLPEYLGPEAYASFRRLLAPDTVRLLDEVEPGGWVAEVHMQAVMGAIYGGALQGDDEAFMKLAHALALAGISRFMGIFLSLASQRFVLRKVPVVWKRLRRNAGEVVAEVEGDLVRLHYEGFPYFGDKVYRLLSLANCQALAYAAVEHIPKGRVVTWTDDTLTLEFDLAPS